MKIGFSFGKCLRDIVNGVVAIEDVMVIIARTRIESKDQLINVVKDYQGFADRLQGLDEETCISMATTLWDDGRIHQPRLHGQSFWAGGVHEQYIWMDLVPSVTDLTPAAKDAWETYRMLLALGDKTPPPIDGAPVR